MDIDLTALRAKAEYIKSLPSFGSSMTINGTLWFDVVLALLDRVEKAEADGWLYLNPDTGVEISDQHPVESGECDDAENVRPATASELRILLTDAWGEIDQMKGMRAEISRLRSLLARAGEALGPFAKRAEHANELEADISHWHPAVGAVVTVGDLRTARTISREIQETIGHE